MKKIFEKIKNITIKNKLYIINIILVLCIFFRFWLMHSTNWYVDLNSYYDSRLQICNAINIINGKWLGDYNKFTLCKNLAYPIFIAVINLLHLSYPFGLCAFICFSSFLFARSLKPLVKNSLSRKIIFLITLFNPVGLSFQAANHYRNSIQPWAVLIVISCLIAIYLRRNEKEKIKLFLWSLLGMFFTGFYWNLREDSIWLLPFILIAIIISILHFIIDNKKFKPSILFTVIVCMPLFGIIIWNNIISGINYKHYGIYATNDRTHTYSAKALGQLIKIDDGSNSESNIWVTHDQVEIAKEVSPTFASLRIDLFNYWPQIGDYSIWALRDSVSIADYYKDGKSTDEVYKKIYEELKEAFENGKLKKRNGLQLSDTSGIYRIENFINNLSNGFKLSVKHVNYKEYNVEYIEPILNASSEGDFSLYENVLGIRLRRTEKQLDEIKPDFTLKIQNDNVIKSLHHNRFFVNSITKIYNFLSPIFFVTSIIGLIILVIDIFKYHKYDMCRIEILIFLIGLLLLCFCNSYLICLWATSFYLNTVEDNLYYSYTTVQTLIICCFEIIGTYITIKKCLAKFKNNTK